MRAGQANTRRSFAAAHPVAQAEVELRIRVILHGRARDPLHSSRLVDADAQAELIAHANVVLRARVAGPGSLLEALERLVGVLGHAGALVVAAAQAGQRLDAVRVLRVRRNGGELRNSLLAQSVGAGARGDR